MTRVVLDVGGEGNIRSRQSVSAKPDHPVWGQAVWFTVNLEPGKNPDVLDDAVSLAKFQNGSVDGIYSSHTIEHIDPALSHTMFESWFKVLKPGGRIEIRCPDVEWTWQEYFSGRLPEAIITELLMGIRVGPLEIHRNMWWESKLTKELEDCGFTSSRRINYGFSRPYLDFWPYDGEHVKYHGFRVVDLLVEAFKPPVPEVPPWPDVTEYLSYSRQTYKRSVQFRRFFPVAMNNLLNELALRRQRKQAAMLLLSVLNPR